MTVSLYLILGFAVALYASFKTMRSVIENLNYDFDGILELWDWCVIFLVFVVSVAFWPMAVIVMVVRKILLFLFRGHIKKSSHE